MIDTSMWVVVLNNKLTFFYEKILDNGTSPLDEGHITLF